MVLGAAAVPAASTEGRRREADAEEVRTRGALSAVATSALPLRRLHVADQARVCRCLRQSLW